MTPGKYFEKYLKLLNIFMQNSGYNKEKIKMASMDEQILRATKEIVVKFIEGGRISPAGFPDFFKNIYQTVHDTAKDASDSSAPVEKKG